MVDKFVNKVKELFRQVKSSEGVQKSVESAKSTASELGESAQKKAGEAANRAKATAGDLTDKAKAKAKGGDIPSGPASTADTVSGQVKQATSSIETKGSAISGDATSDIDQTASDAKSAAHDGVNGAKRAVDKAKSNVTHQ